MDSLKTECLAALEGWKAYAEMIRRLAPAERQQFVEQQGYLRLADLLGHVIAWWEEGIPAVKCLLDDPDWKSPDYDVDAFNAAAVDRFAAWDEAAVMALFEQRRREWIELLWQLPESAWQNPNLCSQIEIELVGHLREHS